MLRIDGQSVNAIECFAHGFVQGRVSMNGAHHCFYGRFGFHGGNGLGNQLERFRSNDVDAKNFAELLVRDDLDESRMVALDAGFAVGREREFSNLHRVALRARLCFGQANAADAGLGVGTARNAILVNWFGGTAGHVRNGHHAFHFGHMRQLRGAGDNVADGVDSRLAGELELIRFYEAAIQLDLEVLDANVAGHRLAPNCDQQCFGLHVLALAVGQRDAHADAVFGPGNVLGFGAGLTANSGLPEVPVQFFGDLFVLDGNDARQHFDHSDFGAEAIENGRELDADRARADDQHAFRNRGQIENLDISQNGFRVGLQAGKHAGFRTGGDDDVLSFVRLGVVPGLHVDAQKPIGTPRLERPVALDPIDLVFLKQELDALGMLGDDLVLAVLYAGEIEPGILALNAFFVGVNEAFPDVGGMEQRLGGDTSHQQARTAQAGVLFHQGGLEPVLRAANRGGITARATPNHNQVVGHFKFQDNEPTSLDAASSREIRSRHRYRYGIDRRQIVSQDLPVVAAIARIED